MNIEETIEIIESTVYQFYNDRLYLTHSIGNTLSHILGGEDISFKKYINKLKNSNLDEISMVKIESENTKEITELKKRHSNLLEKLI